VGKSGRFFRGKESIIAQEVRTMNKKIALIALVLAVAGIPGLFAGGGSQQSQPGSSSSAAPVQGGGKYKQAPILEGKNLPPVDQRLPENPLVITPLENIGKYGGTWTQSVTEPYFLQAMSYMGYYEGQNIAVFDQAGKEIVPNLAESYAISPDGKDFTFTLRKGLKYSNGDPLTTNDVKFWYEDFLTNPDLFPGTPMFSVEVVNDLTFIMHFNNPSPGSIYSLARYPEASGGWSLYLPDEYLKKFHIKYNANVETEARAAGFNTWQDYFRDMANVTINTELPVMGPYKMVSKTVTMAVFERNPYFFAVDTQGNQLPYIDRCVFNRVESEDTIKMRVLAGESDMQMASISENFMDYPLFMSSAAAGNYSVYVTQAGTMNGLPIHINIAHKDPVKRALFINPEFKKAL
jgi:peptide/nickel transport system substrate-binding protein